MMKPGVIGNAEFSDDRKCRWTLSRIWQEDLGLVFFTGLNPSKAGADTDDMTVTKGMGFARKWQYGGTLHGNAFPFITTYPKELVSVARELIEENDRKLLEMARRAKLVVLAWGSYPKYAERFRAVAELLAPFNPVCVGRTKDSFPHHISRIAYKTPIEPWRSASA